MLKEKQQEETLTDEGQSSGTDAPDVVITESAGSVQEIKGFFSRDVTQNSSEQAPCLNGHQGDSASPSVTLCATDHVSGITINQALIDHPLSAERSAVINMISAKTTSIEDQGLQELQEESARKRKFTDRLKNNKQIKTYSHFSKKQRIKRRRRGFKARGRSTKRENPSQLNHKSCWKTIR